jgi:hypothetical protein
VKPPEGFKVALAGRVKHDSEDVERGLLVYLSDPQDVQEDEPAVE